MRTELYICAWLSRNPSRDAVYQVCVSRPLIPGVLYGPSKSPPRGLFSHMGCFAGRYWCATHVTKQKSGGNNYGEKKHDETHTTKRTENDLKSKLKKIVRSSLCSTHLFPRFPFKVFRCCTACQRILWIWNLDCEFF